MNGLRTVIITLWIGSLWTIAMVVMPNLFNALEFKQASYLVQRIALPISYIGFACASFVLIDLLLCYGLYQTRRASFWLATSVLLCNLIQYFLVNPIIHNLKKTMTLQPTGLLSGGFETWHAISMGLFLAQCVLGLSFILFDQQGQEKEQDSSLPDHLSPRDSNSTVGI
jgi:hypothetical protein